jgi:hypothetical protein
MFQRLIEAREFRAPFHDTDHRDDGALITRLNLAAEREGRAVEARQVEFAQLLGAFLLDGIEAFQFIVNVEVRLRQTDIKLLSNLAIRATGDT